MEPNSLSEIYFRITLEQSTVEFQRINGKFMYENDDGGFIRKALINKSPSNYNSNTQFHDLDFILHQSNNYSLIRLYDLYKKQIPLFPQDQKQSSFVQSQKTYNSFLAESSVISYDYLRTLFITQQINKQGYYEYFVKRNGQYYLQCCDDFIPIDRVAKKLFWNLQLSHPWQILLFKVWLKQCGSLENLINAQPFRFLEAFGLPQYKLYNFRKQYLFMKNSRYTNQISKKQKQRTFAMNKNDVIIIAKTINDKSVQRVGLLPNFAGYRTLRINNPNQDGLYRVYSSLPCSWVGQYSPIKNTQLNKIINKEMYLDLQRNFIATQKELITYFNKFYVVPFDLSQPEYFVTQDCLNLKSQKGKPIWLCFEVKSNQGMLAISIQMPKKRLQNNRYPQFRYFLTKSKNQQQIARSHFRPDIGSERQGNMYIQSNCDKWDYYAIDYVQGYHNNAAIFCGVVEGFYVLFINADFDGLINVRFDSMVAITRPQIYLPDIAQKKQIFDSTFFTISQDLGVQASLFNQKFQQSICLNNSFEQLGYGSISIKTLTNAKHRIAMRVYPENLRKAGYKLLDFYDQLQNDKQKEKNFILISSKGRPQIIILEKIQNRSQSTLGTAFPPQNGVQFFKLTPQPQKTYKNP